eukprot:CAMPEP_0181522800 /NCGR_PEP_ID=MMETSP1110-20121109/67567_1 /TAXON_ID=174948 /ORGANISM="Symbiodinium sp., Strain CCMP421" /LENGTH=126 /DNA_ID=CAMNT_0023653441 /DNA_START=14 /DNA_END=392 /DNA_ORIENTATION=-
MAAMVAPQPLATAAEEACSSSSPMIARNILVDELNLSAIDHRAQIAGQARIAQCCKLRQRRSEVSQASWICHAVVAPLKLADHHVLAQVDGFAWIGALVAPPIAMVWSEQQLLRCRHAGACFRSPK